MVSLLLLFALGLQAQTVYVTENGKKFHAKNCSLAKTGKKGITLAQASKDGYEACKNCKSDEIKETKQPADKPKAAPKQQKSQK